MGPTLEFGDRFIRQVYVLTVCRREISPLVLGVATGLVHKFMLHNKHE